MEVGLFITADGGTDLKTIFSAHRACVQLKIDYTDIFVSTTESFVDATIGSFYEQFGAGLAFRAYEDRALGYDNMMDGFRLIVRPYSGITLKGVYGHQRLSFEKGLSTEHYRRHKSSSGPHSTSRSSRRETLGFFLGHT